MNENWSLFYAKINIQMVIFGRCKQKNPWKILSCKEEGANVCFFTLFWRSSRFTIRPLVSDAQNFTSAKRSPLVFSNGKHKMSGAFKDVRKAPRTSFHELWEYFKLPWNYENARGQLFLTSSLEFSVLLAWNHAYFFSLKGAQNERKHYLRALDRFPYKTSTIANAAL